MEPVRLAYWEGLVGFAGLTVALARRLWLDGPTLRALVSDESGRLSVGRVQLLVVALAVAARYAWVVSQQAMGQGNGAMPQVGVASLAAFGLSGGVYGMLKAMRLLHRR